MSADNPSTFDEYAEDLRKAERKVAGEIDPGARAVVVAIAVLVALMSILLPHAGNASGLDVLIMSDKARAESIALPSQVFVYLLVIFAIGFSMIALVSRRWVLAWTALCGSAVAAVAGMLAIWTRNTVGVASWTDPSDAAIGLYLGWVAAIVLTFHWSRAVWARSSYHLQVEAQRREEAAAAEARGLAMMQRSNAADQGPAGA